MKIQKKIGGGRGLGGRSGLGCQGGCVRRIEVFVKIQNNKKLRGGVGGWVGWGVGLGESGWM